MPQLPMINASRVSDGVLVGYRCPERKLRKPVTAVLSLVVFWVEDFAQVWPYKARS